MFMQAARKIWSRYQHC